MDASNEWYVQLLLADGNLPTGSSVATQSSSPDDMVGPTLTQATIDFIRDSLQNYAQTTLSFISGVHDILSEFRVGGTSREAAQDQVKYLDDLYESMTPNHVTRRASKAQGVALLTLYSKGFSKPSWSTLPSSEADGDGVDKILEGMKLMIRKGDSPGHLPICWALLTAALDLTKGRSQHLHLFLHARSVLSASIRLNTIGPYAAQQLLRHIIRPLVDAALAEYREVSWKEWSGFDAPCVSDVGPATTWPLGEILAGRHDLQHSRIFNS